MASSGKTTVLLYVLYPSHFRVIARVARLLKESGRYSPVVLFDGSPPFARDSSTCEEIGVECLGPDGRPVGAATASADYGVAAVMAPERPPKKKLAARALSWLPDGAKERLRGLHSVLRLRREVGIEFEDLQRRVAFFRELIARTGATLAVIPGDSVGYGTPMLVRAMHDAGGKVVIVPFTVSNSGEVIGDLRRFPDYRTSRLDNWLLARAHPHWAAEAAGNGRLVRMAAKRAFAFERLGLAPANPWLLNSGRADALATESDFMLDYYRREGLPVDRCTLTGTLGDDAVSKTLALADARREELYRELGLPPGRPMMLLSLSDYSHFLKIRPHPEFKSFDELVDFWLSTMEGATGWNGVISLHPWMRYEDKKGLERRATKISTRAIEELIPLCDFYVVSISATVRTAIACGKPVVDHDVFQFRLQNFTGMEDAVFIVETREAFRSAIAKLTDDPEKLLAATEAQRRRAHRFGILDGHNHERFLALFDRLGERN